MSQDVSGELIAHHEAAHALAHVVLRLGMRYVTLRPRSGDAHGLVKTTSRRPPDEQRLDTLIKHAVAALSGPLAELKLTGADRSMYDNDWVRANDYLEIISPGDLRQASVDAAQCWSRVIADRHWPQINAVAASLVERRTLQRSEVFEIMMHSEPWGSPKEAE